MGSYTITTLPAAIFWAVAMVVAVSGQGDGQMGACVSKLTDCASYINGTTMPPPSCCTPLKDAVTNQKACLCNFYNTPGLLKSFGINVTQALDLPFRCKITSNPDPKNFCKGVSPSGSPSTNSSSTPSTPSTPSGGSGSGAGSGSGSNSAVTITGTGFVSSLLMFVAYMVVY